MPLTVCLDDVELNDPQAELPVERLHPRAIPKVRVNQVGYLPGLPKVATVATDADAPLDWQLVDAHGRVRASGKTRPFGDDRSSGERVQQIDFSSVTETGEGWKLRVGGEESVPFAIGADVYRRLKYDALAFFYLQRSGIPIKMPYAGSPAFERAAGHVGDKSVACAPESHCSYSLDASGGWYDAGDHGKYVVNGGFSVWLLQNQYETLSRFGTTAAAFGDGKMKIPESKNGRPDLLDEARWGLELFLRLQVPAGQPMAGMVHQKVHGDKWSNIPTSPAHDDIKRYVRPVSTAATLEPGGGRRAGGAPVAKAGSRLLGALPDGRRDRLRRRQARIRLVRAEHDTPGGRRLRRRRAGRRVLLGRGGALHHHREARVRRRARPVALSCAEDGRGGDGRRTSAGITSRRWARSAWWSLPTASGKTRSPSSVASSSPPPITCWPSSARAATASRCRRTACTSGGRTAPCSTPRSSSASLTT